jgi:hypothetical protein
MKRSILLGLAVAAFAVFSSEAQIERLTLSSMVQKTDDALIAEIVGSEVIRIDHPVDGPELYFTHLTLEGQSMRTDANQRIVVTFAGGFINDEEGVWNSEAPSADDIKIGNRVVAFYKHVENLGGDLEANALYASHGGLFRTVDSPNGVVVMGRGEGYAIGANVRLDELSKSVKTLSKQEEL